MAAEHTPANSIPEQALIGQLKQHGECVWACACVHQLAGAIAWKLKLMA